MKRVFPILTLLLVGLLLSAQAQDVTSQKQKRDRSPREQSHHPHHHDYDHQDHHIKDKGEGAPINFGVAFAPVFSWMYPTSEGYYREGVVIGMRYGIPLNINLTKRKNYYISTGVYIEQIGGKLLYRNGVSIPEVGVSINSEVHTAFRPTYITIPLGITLKTHSINNFFVCGNFGVYNSLLLQAHTIDSYRLGDEMWTREKKIYKDGAMFKEAAFGGLGFEYSVTPDMRAGLMVNYVQSFTNFFKGRNQAYNSVLGVNPKTTMGYVELELHINFF